MQATVLSDICC